jgi:hypothetical protein
MPCRCSGQQLDERIYRNRHDASRLTSRRLAGFCGELIHSAAIVPAAAAPVSDVVLGLASCRRYRSPSIAASMTAGAKAGQHQVEKQKIPSRLPPPREQLLRRRCRATSETTTPAAVSSMMHSLMVENRRHLPLRVPVFVSRINP